MAREKKKITLKNTACRSRDSNNTLAMTKASKWYCLAEGKLWCWCVVLMNATDHQTKGNNHQWNEEMKEKDQAGQFSNKVAHISTCLQFSSSLPGRDRKVTVTVLAEHQESVVKTNSRAVVSWTEYFAASNKLSWPWGSALIIHTHSGKMMKAYVW